MANTIISTDPDTKKQKTVKIPDGCIAVEMSASDMSQFIMKTFVGFVFVDLEEHFQIFPKEIKTIKDIWRYVYPIRQGVAALIVNEERWNNLTLYLSQKEEDEKNTRMIKDDIASRKTIIRNAMICWEMSRGNVSKLLIDDIFEYRRGEKTDPFTWDNELCNMIDKYGIDVSSLYQVPFKARSFKEAEHEIVSHFSIGNKDRLYLLEHSNSILIELLSIPKKSVGSSSSINYDEQLNLVKREALQQLLFNSIDLDDELQVYKIYKKLIVEEISSFVFSSLMDYYIIKNDEKNLLSISKDAMKKHPDIALPSLIKYYKKRNDTKKELHYIEQYIKTYPNQESYMFKRLVELKARKGTIIPPISHMEESTIPIVSLKEIDAQYPDYDIMWGRVGSGYYVEGRRAEAMFNYRKATDIYETLVLNGYDSTSPYDRLMIIYRKFKMYDDEIRIINLALIKFGKTDYKIINQWQQRLKTAKGKKII